MACSGHGVGLLVGCANCGGCAQRPGNNPLEWRYSVAISQGTFYPEELKVDSRFGIKLTPWNLPSADGIYNGIEALAVPVNAAWDTSVSHGSVVKSYSIRDDYFGRDYFIVGSYIITDYQLLRETAEYWRYATMFVGGGAIFADEDDASIYYLQLSSLANLFIPKPGHLCPGEWDLVTGCVDAPGRERPILQAFQPGLSLRCSVNQTWFPGLNTRNIPTIPAGGVRVRRKYVPTTSPYRGIDTDDTLYPVDVFGGGIQQSYTLTFSGADFGDDRFDNSDPATMPTTFTVTLAGDLSNGLVWTSGDSSVPNGGHYAWLSMMKVFMETQDTSSSVAQTRFAWVPLAFAEFTTDDGSGFAYSTYGYLGGQWWPIGPHFNLFVLDSFPANTALQANRDLDFPRATLTVTKA